MFFFSSENALEMAKMINTAEIFMGNQSLACSMAIGLGKTCFIEEGRSSANYIFTTEIIFLRIMKNAITTLHTPWNYQELADLTNPNKQRYCDKHGYDFVPHFTNFDFDKYYVDENRPKGMANWHGGFEKIGLVLRLLKSGKYDWVFWLGTDTLITNFDIKIEDVTDNNYHFIIANDCNEWNSDSFLARSTQRV